MSLFLISVRLLPPEAQALSAAIDNNISGLRPYKPSRDTR